MRRDSGQHTVLELCAGGGGQALGLEIAGFESLGAVEIEQRFCETLKLNRPHWNIIQADLKSFNAQGFSGVDLVAGGVPCPPFSIAGKQRGSDDDRDLFPSALRIVRETNPKAVLLENVPGFGSSKFEAYRNKIARELLKMGYVPEMRILQASDFAVPQLRPRFIIVALKPEYAPFFAWPTPDPDKVSVASALFDLMSSAGWQHARRWSVRAEAVAPTLVGGSKLHGGPDLGPTRARRQWAELGIDGRGIADAPPSVNHDAEHMPRLTVRMAARIQGFPDNWVFAGGKTSAYRQIGNAFPPPVATAVGRAIKRALSKQKVI